MILFVIRDFRQSTQEARGPEWGHRMELYEVREERLLISQRVSMDRCCGYGLISGHELIVSSGTFVYRVNCICGRQVENVFEPKPVDELPPRYSVSPVSVVTRKML